MKLEADTLIPFPRDVVLSTYRDRLPDLVPYLPNVRGIKVVNREEIEGTTRLVNEWTANAEIPSLLKSLINVEALGWIDRAEWNQATYSCRWQIEPSIFTNNVVCEGVNYYIEDGDGTRLEIRGDLTVNPKGIPGVPSLLAGRVAPVAEKFIVNLITPNLLSVAKGLESFLTA
ncbi:MAG: hypothetical protein KTR25_12570 [Myxococcales bacterium]|nr:hypothetical protein [Myxococcales bacterium]